MDKKIFGAVMSSVLYSIICLLVPIIITYFQITEVDKIPWLFYYIIILFYLLPVIGIIINLIGRIKEIKGGEEDDASKY